MGGATATRVAVAEPCWELADGTREDIPEDFLADTTKLTGTLKLGAAVKTIGVRAFARTKLTRLDLSGATSLVIPAKVETIGEFAFRLTKLTGLDLSQAVSLVTIGKRAFGETNLEGTLVIPAKVKTIGEFAFYKTMLTSLDLSQAASLVTIGKRAFGETNLE